LTPDDDPFGRKGEEQTDAFGRPVDESSESLPAPAEGSLWSGQAERAAPEQPRPGGFLPPTDAPAEQSAWWTEPQQRPSGPSAPSTSTATSKANLATYGERVGAAVIDFFIRAAIALFFLFVGAASGSEDAAAAGLVIGYYLIAPFYAPIAMTRWEGQTVGHRAVGTRIVTRKGSPVTGGKAVTREVLVKNLVIEIGGGLLSLGVFGIVNYLWPLWDKDNEALHDKMCDTRVVKA
jgi:uncharacterized RDD family membrane protein YckC